VPALSVNETVQGIDLAKLAKAMFDQDNITGSIAGNFRLGGRGHDMAEIQNSLGGTMSFELKDGTYEGTDIWYELRRARALLKEEEPPEPVLPARTKFSTVTASGVVKNGVMRNDDLVAELPFMRLTGSGDVNIPQGTVDYSLNARVLKKPDAMDGATSEEIEDFTKTVIPLKITGSLASPSVRPDLESLLRQRVEEEVKEKIEDKLKDLFKR
jgi:AsmA protein